MDMNKFKTTIIYSLLFLTVLEMNAQFPAKYWVKFNDKNG